LALGAGEPDAESSGRAIGVGVASGGKRSGGTTRKAAPTMTTLRMAMMVGVQDRFIGFYLS
jgi:hypothetical protein